MLTAILATAPPLWVIPVLILLEAGIRAFYHRGIPRYIKLAIFCAPVIVSLIYMYLFLFPVDTEISRFFGRWALISLFGWNAFFSWATRKYHRHA